MEVVGREGNDGCPGLFGIGSDRRMATTPIMLFC
jgi:hypothetical protein